MFRSLLVLFAVGVGGMFALGLLTAIIGPLLGLIIKIAFIVIIGYVILRLFRPEKAEEMRDRFKST